ncbi:Glycoside hydrolase [Theobroma cacao]|nr:Glycoside hydrolase [Theobroma cacao]
MEAEWRDKKLYPLLGILLLSILLYLNFGNTNLISFPISRQPRLDFVSANSTHFIIVNGGGAAENQSAAYVNGWNSYWLMQESVWGGPSRSRVSKMLQRGAQMGLTVCRTWAFSDGNGPNALQISPGVFNERVFRGLDYVIVEARKHGIRLVLSLVNNLNNFGGKAQYVRWAQEAGINVSSSSDSFFSHPMIKDYYKAYVKAILSRKNSLTGVKYSDEPAIFAWELMNEPRCESSSSAPILQLGAQAWITEMAAFVKSLDQKHLVTVGLEGFYGLNTTKGPEVNPGEWAASLGSDFIQNSAIENIDFASVHAYPDSWIPHADLEEKTRYLSQWVDSHISDGDQVLKKPILFTEVGSLVYVNNQSIADKDILLKTMYDKIYESAKKRQAGAGALIWQLLVEGVEEYGDRFSFIAWDKPSTYKLILRQSCRLQSIFPKSSQNRKLSKDPCSENPLFASELPGIYNQMVSPAIHILCIFTIIMYDAASMTSLKGILWWGKKIPQASLAISADRSESLGFPPLQSHRLIHFDLEVPPHKHRAMQRISGTHEGQPYFIWSRMQALHPLPLDGHARAGEAIEHNISSIIRARAKICLCEWTFLGYCCFNRPLWNRRAAPKRIIRDLQILLPVYPFWIPGKLSAWLSLPPKDFQQMMTLVNLTAAKASITSDSIHHFHCTHCSTDYTHQHSRPNGSMILRAPSKLTFDKSHRWQIPFWLFAAPGPDKQGNS